MSYPGYTPNPHPARPTGFAVTALVLGIVSFLGSWLPFIGVLLGVLAIVFSILGLVKKQPAGFAYTGLVLGTIATLLCLVITVILSTHASSAISGANTAPPTHSSTTEESSAPTSDKQQFPSSFSDGVYVAGIDIAPGTYRTEDAVDLCRFKWRAGTSANSPLLDSTSLYDGGSATATIEDGQAFETKRCGTWNLQ